MERQVVLTPAESKVLIAKGVSELPFVKKALKEGTVAIAKGTTNSYVVEALTGEDIPNQQYVTGMTFPAKGDKSWLPKGRIDDVILKAGAKVANVAVTDAIKDMRRGDVFIKGANSLDYTRKVAGIYIGNINGGTIGATWGTIVARGIRLVIPVGLEKLVYTDLAEVSRRMAAAEYEGGSKHGLMPVTGDIITEIEALQVVFGVDALQIGAGGIGGAEGSVHLLLSGDADSVQRAIDFFDSNQGEPAFAELQ